MDIGGVAATATADRATDHPAPATQPLQPSVAGADATAALLGRVLHEQAVTDPPDPLCVDHDPSRADVYEAVRELGGVVAQ